MRVQLRNPNDTQFILKTKSLDKLLSHDSQSLQSKKRLVTATTQPQKQNLPTTTSVSFITLKPHQKTNSRPNIIITPPCQVTNAQPNTPRTLQIISTNTGNPVMSHLRPTSQLQPQPLTILSSLDTTNNHIIKEEQNNGYGIVENPYPEFIQNKQINYQNLYNIGKAWLKFQGSFSDGCKEGPGTIYLTNGHLFNGFFVKDLANGKGTVYVNGEPVLKGTWKNNILATQF